MPVMNGLEAMRKIKTPPGAPRVVILALHNNAAYCAAAVAVGAHGLVAKSEFGATLPAQIRRMFPEFTCSKEWMQ